MIQPAIGMPGVGFVRRAQHKVIFRQYDWESGLGGGRAIDGAKSRDPTNGTTPQYLQAGLLMGKITATGLYAPSIIGKNSVAVVGTDTTITVLAATATEIIRRIGTSGTVKLTGPPAASGIARTSTVTFSAVGATSLTTTALRANQVEQINFNAASTAGNLQLNVQKPDGTYVTTGNAAWNATDATYLANINTALDTATGVVGGIVASAIPSVDPDLGIRLTYSGTGYAGLAWQPAEVQVFPTSSTAAIYTPITAASSGEFVANSFLQPTDGSENILTILPDGFPLQVVDAAGADVTVPFARIPIAGVIKSTQVVNWPSDTGLRTWVRSQLDQTAGGGKFVFDDRY